MPSTDYGQRRLTRSACHAPSAHRAIGDIGDALHKHRCLLNHSSQALYPVLAHPQSPIARLSNEELLLIFEEAAYSAFEDPLVFSPTRKPSILVTVSHVCSRWRGIALSNSSLWAHIFARSLSDVGQHLSHSGTRPLNICGVFHSQQVTTGSLSTEGSSVAIAEALAESAHRWQALHWYDDSANNIASVLRLMNTSKAYPILETLEVILPTRAAFGGIMVPATVNDAILFPALKILALTGVHPMILPHSPMPLLEILKLERLSNMRFSHLFCLLHRSPALRSLVLHQTFLMVDLLAINSVPPPPRLFRNGPLRGSRLKLPQLVHLSLDPAPASDFAFLFCLLDLPALECLDLYVHTSPHTHYWPVKAPEGGVRLLQRPVSSTAPIVSMLHTLRLTYHIPSEPAPAPAPGTHPTLPQLRNIMFPALTDLQIAHVFMRLGAQPEDTLPPPPQPLRPFDALFHAPAFTHVARLTLTGCALPFRALCDALQTRFPALEVLVLSACPGAGALVCALAPGDCGVACEKWGAWIGRTVREVVVGRCEDVRAECLRKVIEARGRVPASSRLQR